MADGKVKISELSQALQLNDNAVFPYTQDNGGTDTTFKAPMTQIARKINEDIDFTNLETSSKKVVGAINQTVNNFAEVYDPTSTYNQNDPVLYGGTLYKCNANNVTGAWDSTKWDEAKAVEFGSGGGGASYATELPISSTDPTNTKAYIDTKTTLIKSASGSLIHISDGGDDIPIKSCNITIDPDLQGKTEANLVVCGKNLLPSYNLSGSSTLTINSNNGVYSISGTTSGYMNVIASDSFFLKSGTYTFKNIGNSSNYLTAQLRSVDGQTIYASSSNTSNTFTLTETTELKFRFTFSQASNTYNETCKPELEIGNEANTFNQYNGTTYNIPFGQTVYGGEGDVLSGEFISNYAFIDENDFDMASGTTSGGLHYFNIKSALNGRISGKVEVICNELPYLVSGGWASTTPCICSYESSGAVDVRIYCASTSIEDFKTTYANLQIIYPIDNGTTLSLTPVNPKTISGINNIYNDCGSTEIDYFTESADEVADLIRTQPAPMVHYSTNEQIVGTWIDGKPLYEKTIDFGALPNTTTKSVNHNISNLDKVAFLNGVAYKSGDIIPIPFSHSGNVSNQTPLSIGNTTVNIRTANDQSDRTGYITVRYTKSS